MGVPTRARWLFDRHIARFPKLGHSGGGQIVKWRSVKIPRFLKIAVIVVLVWSTTAFAVIPLVVHGAVLLASATIFAATIQAQSGGAAGRTLAIYASRAGGFVFSKSPYNVSWGDGSVTSDAYAVPSGSRNGVQLQLKTPESALGQQISAAENAGRYPNIRASLVANLNPLPIGSWGTGNAFDSSLVPSPGGLISDSDGNVYKVGTCGTFYQSPSAYCYQMGKFEMAGDHRSYRIWSGPRNCSLGTSQGLSCTVSRVGGSSINLDDYTPEQIRAALAANPAEVAQAQRDLYQSKNGLTGTLQASSTLPAASGGGELVYPNTTEKPRVADIIAAVDSADATTANTGTAQPDTDNPPPAVTTTTTTSRVRGQATVTTDPQTGARTVTYPTEVTVTDAQGNVISRQTEYFIGTYPAGVALPAEVQAAVDGVSESAQSTESTTTAPPANLTKPDLAQIDFTPLAQGADLLKNKFPFSLLASVTLFLDSFYVEPQTPEFTIPIGEHDCVVSLSLLDNFAYWWRRMIKIIALAYSAWFAVNLCMR